MKQLFKHLKRTFHDLDKRLLLSCIVINLIGLLFIASSASSQFGGAGIEIFSYFFKQTALLIGSSIVSIVILSIDSSVYKKVIWGIYGLIVFILSFMLLSGDSHRGSINWIQISGISFQPSEFMKLTLIILIAVLFEKYYNHLSNPKENHLEVIGKITLTALLPMAIIFFQRDLGTMSILFSILAIMLIMSPIPIIEKAKTGLYIIILVVISFLLIFTSENKIFTEEQLDRFDYTNPCSNYEEGGYQVCNSIIAINNGNLFGVGAGKSSQKYSYIPEAHTDSIFAIIVEEMGLLLSTIIFLLYAYIMYRILILACYANTIRGRYICMGVAGYLMAHIFINLGGLFALIPLTGIPLPFISYGGSFIISATFSLAVVQRIHIETKCSYKHLIYKKKKAQ